ncbi:MAG TPA: hypothetical protein P5033_09790 [Anaerohalosphaeraceae bacterium]|nr:hypothetical protein [Anaerohalosphaeraceae bacterium]HRT24360.1 hypothetical protein [Anaerohalosphaeraceae bacterium]
MITQTYISSYQRLGYLEDISVSHPSDYSALTDFAIGPKAGEIDLTREHGTGVITCANAVCLIVRARGASAGDTLTQDLYGRVDGGPVQKIARIVWQFGAARADGETSDYLWAETATVESFHPTGIAVCGSTGDSKVGSVLFDAVGYRYLSSLFTDYTGSLTEVECLYRVY